MRLFADDSKVYTIIYDKNDEKQLQCDLNTLHKWSENWQLRNVRFYVLPLYPFWKGHQMFAKYLKNFTGTSKKIFSKKL